MPAAVQGGQAVLTEDALAEKEAAAKGGDGAQALAGAADQRDSSRARSRRAIEPVSKDQVRDTAARGGLPLTHSCDDTVMRCETLAAHFHLPTLKPWLILA